MQSVLIMASVAWLVAGPAQQAGSAAGPPSMTLKDCLITLVAQAEVPAKEAGVLEELTVTPGQEVTKGTVLGHIDDAQVVKAREVALYKLQVAQKEAENDINVRYAQAANLVADAEYNQAVDANRKAPSAVPQAELRRLLLECRKTSLGIEQADHDLAISRVTVQVRQAELDLADEDIRRRQIIAPIDGVVVKQHVHVGEWVKPGDPVLRIVRMDRLRIEVFLNVDEVSPAQLVGQDVRVKVRLPPGEEKLFAGKVVFVSPIVEVGRRFLVWAEVVNTRHPRTGDWLLRPGLDAEMTIQLKHADASR